MGSEFIKINKKTLAILGLGVIVVSFLGILLGNQFVVSRQRQIAPESDAFHDIEELGLLSRGDMFPNVELIDLEGTQVNTNDLIGDKKTVVMFLYIGCDPCIYAINSWKPYADEIPENMQIIGICRSDKESARAYWEETESPFALYCDTAATFMYKYEILRYPSIVGLTQNGVITFLQHGYSESFDPSVVIELISSNE